MTVYMSVIPREQTGKAEGLLNTKEQQRAVGI